jgi:hypothetical protein
MIDRTRRPLTRERLVRAHAYAEQRNRQTLAAARRWACASPFWGLLALMIGAKLAGWDAGYRREEAMLRAILGDDPACSTLTPPSAP